MRIPAVVLSILALLVFSCDADIPPYAVTTYCTSNSTCWPSSTTCRFFGGRLVAQYDDLHLIPGQSLNSSVGGRLSRIIPWAAPCYNASTEKTTACKTVQNGYLDGVARASVPGSMQSLNWEECLGQNCASYLHYSNLMTSL